jgi:membrane protein implicated in regulation of membrane protease activity
MPQILEFIRSVLFVWYNLPFLLLLLLCLGLGLLQFVGGADGGGDADADVDADVDVDADADADADGDDGGDGGNGAAPAFNLFSFVGFGKAPLLIVLMILFGSIAVSGLVLNWIAFRIFGAYTGVSFVVVLAVALVLGAVTGAAATQIIRTILPPLTTTASRAQELVGQRGTVISPFVDERYGQVRLRNPGGVMISIFAVTRSATPIKRGEEVLLESYDPAKRLYLVTPLAKH